MKGIIFGMLILISTQGFGAMAPDGSYVGGDSYNMAPDGSYNSGSTSTMTPDGGYVGGDSYNMALDGSYY